MNMDFTIDHAAQIIWEAQMAFKHECADLLMEANMTRLAYETKAQDVCAGDWSHFVNLSRDDYLYMAAVRLYNEHQKYLNLHNQLDSLRFECRNYNASYSPLKVNACINFAHYLMGSEYQGYSSMNRHFDNTGILADEILKTKGALWLAGLIESASRFIVDLIA